MTARLRLTAAVLAASLLSTAAAGQSPADSREVRTTILRGQPAPTPVPARPVAVLANGDISLNFPAVDVQAAARAILGDTLQAPYSLDPNLHQTVTVRTPHPIRRADVAPLFEQSLADAGLALVTRGGGYAILTAAAARGEAPAVGPDDPGYGAESVPLKFVNAEEMRKLLDPLVPNAVAVADPGRNLLVISGDATQRRALRELVAQFDVDWLRGMSFALFVPQRTDARLIVPELERLINAPGAPTAGLVRLIAMDRLNGILAITAQPQYLDDARRFIEVLDREGESAERRVFVYHVQNGRAADLAKVINSVLGASGSGAAQTDTDAPGLTDHSAPAAATVPQPAPAAFFGQTTPQGTAAPAARQANGAGAPATGDASAAPASGSPGVNITADETNNAVVVYGTPRDYAVISDALAKLDTPPLQVMIDASISEVTLNHNLQYGIQWSFASGRNSGALTQGSTGAPVQNFPGFSYLYQGANFTAVLNALATVTDVTVLSAPKLMVLNNHTATIEVGDQVPISTGSAVSTLTTGAPIVNSIEYRDTGVILKVTPRVNSGGLVLLDIAQEVSQVAANTTSAISSPTIQQRKISTSVAVADGETVALGGLMKNEVTKGRSTIPGLGAIPVLGHLLGDTTGGLVRTELVVLLTPRVVRTPVDARAVTQELKDKIHLGAPPPRKTHGP